MAPPPSSPTWVFLKRKARVCGEGGSKPVLPQGADVSLELAAPPRESVLTVSPRVSPRDVTVLALDPSAGLVLVQAPSPADSDELLPWAPYYFVCDVAAGTASRVPYPGEPTLHDDVGVIAKPGGGGKYVVVEFKPVLGDDGDDDTMFLYFSSELGMWLMKFVENPAPDWPWIFDDVVSHDGKLWWVDTSKGLVFWDPFDHKAMMKYHYYRIGKSFVVIVVPLDPLPEDDKYVREFVTFRIVQLSDGKFRRVDISSASNGAAPEISMRTLVNPGTRVWTLEYTVSFADIWASESYKATKLPVKAPGIANTFVHPKNPNVLYFFPDEHLLGVDMRARKVVEYEASVSSDSVLTWELPPALSAGLCREGAANGANGAPSNPNGA